MVRAPGSSRDLHRPLHSIPSPFVPISSRTRASPPQLAMKACPYRADFYAKLGSPPERVDEELHKWLDALEKIVKQLQDFYKCVECRRLSISSSTKCCC